MVQEQKNDVTLTVRYPQRLIDEVDQHRRASVGKIPSRQQVARKAMEAYLKRKETP